VRKYVVVRSAPGGMPCFVRNVRDNNSNNNANNNANIAIDFTYFNANIHSDYNANVHGYDNRNHNRYDKCNNHSYHSYLQTLCRHCVSFRYIYLNR
jgi:hypothetical protein